MKELIRNCFWFGRQFPGVKSTPLDLQSLDAYQENLFKFTTFFVKHGEVQSFNVNVTYLLVDIDQLTEASNRMIVKIAM